MSIFGPAVALMIIDMVNDFVSPNGSMYVSGVEAIIAAIKQLSDEARNSESPVIYICDSQEGSEALVNGNRRLKRDCLCPESIGDPEPVSRLASP